jgi:hypothetical protein
MSLLEIKQDNLMGLIIWGIRYIVLYDSESKLMKLDVIIGEIEINFLQDPLYRMTGVQYESEVHTTHRKHITSVS